MGILQALIQKKPQKSHFMKICYRGQGVVVGHNN